MASESPVERLARLPTVAERVLAQKAPPLARLLTIAEVAGALRCSVRHVAALVARGAIPSIRIGRCRRISCASLEEILLEGV